MNSIKLSIISCAIAISAIFTGCSKEDVQAPSSTQLPTQVQSQGEQNYVPFFELAKGDTVSKSVYREKPNTEGKANIVVLYSTESQLKAVGNSTGTGYILDLKTSVRDGNNAPATMEGYTKIPVDLNEGAGGKYIYLYYTKTTSPASALCYIKSRDSSTPFFVTEYKYTRKQGLSFANNGWTDLNQGAGGKYIVLEGCSQENVMGWIIYCAQNNLAIGWTPADINPIRDILIVSSDKSISGSYNGYTIATADLNKGCGGKYIYLCYKK